MRITNMTTKEIIQHIDNMHAPSEDQLVYQDHLRSAMDEIKVLEQVIARLLEASLDDMR